MKKILIVDDDRVVTRFYSHRFEAAGFEAVTAADGESALQALAASKPDVVLLDLQIPKLDGIEVLRRIRAQPDLWALPVVVFTNAYLDDMRRQAWEAGASSFLVKAQCSPKGVVEVVEKLLKPAGPPPTAAYTEFDGGEATAAPVIPFRQAHGLVTSFVSRKDTPEPELLESDEFLQEPARVLARVRVLYEDLAASSDPETRGAALAGMYRKVRSIGGQAAAAGYHDYARYVSAFEGLLRQLHERPDRLTLSARRTVGATVDFLASLLSRVDDLHEHRLTGAQCLVVDDDPVSVEVERAALARAKLTACTTSDPTAALRLAEGQALDLALVDVEMPGMDGYAFCQGLRRLAAHRSTPILFVTSHGDLESRIRCLVAGGHDMLTKPFLGTELAVKALTCVLRHRLALA